MQSENERDQEAEKSGLRREAGGADPAAMATNFAFPMSAEMRG